MLGKLTAEEYLSSIQKRCKHLTASEMLEAMERELERARTGWSHYLFDKRHAPYVDWSAPGALDYSVRGCDVGLEVVLRPGPFERDELSVHVGEGYLEVTGLHEEPGAREGTTRTLRTVRRIPLPVEAEPDGVTARFEEGVLVVKVPKPRRERREVEIE